MNNHASYPSLYVFTGQMLFLPPNQQYQSTEDRLLQNKKKKTPGE